MISLEWLAGYFDGEGTLSVSLTGSNIYTYMEVTSVYRPVLEEIQQDWNGLLFPKPAPRSQKHRQAWCLRWNGTQAISLIGKLCPLLRIKKAQAELLLQEWDTLSRGYKGRGQFLSKELLEKRQCLFQEMKRLKHSEEFKNSVNITN